MRRKLAVLVMGIVISLFMASSVMAADRSITIRLNSQEIYFQEAPVMKNNLCMVALRPLAEAIGAQLSWDQTTGAATAYLNSVALTVLPGESVAKVNDRDILLPVAPTNQNGVIYVPLRAIADIYNLRTSWNAAAWEIDLYTSQGPANDLEAVYQVSMLSALLEGQYDGLTSFGDLKRYGDTGIGTVEGLDGELIELDGQFYQVRADGVGYPVADNQKTPFASVTYFKADKSLAVSEVADYQQIQSRLDSMLGNKNIFYAIKITGDFKYVKTRSVPAQHKPYPPLAEVTKNQPTFEFENVKGTMVGFWCPAYVNGINVPGYHIHFLNADKNAGGHLLDFSMTSGEIEIDATPNFYMTLPQSDDFGKIDMSKDRSQETKTVESTLDKNVAGSCAADAQGVISLDILSVNDFHGAILGSDKNPGAAKLGKWLKDEEAKNSDGTLILSAGDMLQGSVDSNLLYGKTVIEAMNQIGFDAMAVGNHEFDWGMDNLKSQAVRARFPILTANITEKQTGRNPEGTQPWIIVEKKGIKIGIIGLTTMEAVDKVNPKLISSYKIKDTVETVNKLVPELRRQGAQIIIVLGHLGGYVDKDNISINGEAAELANRIKGVDVLVTGHTHQKMAGYINGIPVVQADYNGRAVGQVALKYSTQARKVVSAIPSIIDLPTPSLTEDTGIKAVINTDQKQIASIKNETIGNTVKDLSHQKDEISLLGKWVTDIMRKESKADIAFQNGGGLRTSIPAGKITVGQLWEVIPFDNTLFQMELKGSQILSVLQHGINNPNYGSIQYSGVKVTYNPLLPADKRIVRVTLADGSLLNPEKTYRIVTNDFMAAGGDGYTMFKEGIGISDTHRPIRDMLIEAIKSMQTINFSGDDRFTITGTPGKQAAGSKMSCNKVVLAN